MPAPLESCVVRIYSKSDKVIGAGFLVSAKHILTCAHIITRALGVDQTTTEKPEGEIQLDFPWLANKAKFTAKVVFWLPVNPNASAEDIAGLELDQNPPEDASPAQLVTSENLWGHHFQAFGFPEGQPHGISASGVLRSSTGKGWIQVEDIKETGYRLEPGFSGAPAWDDKLQGVVGMAVAADNKRPQLKVAFIIPSNMLKNTCPFLKDVVKFSQTLSIRKQAIEAIGNSQPNQLNLVREFQTCLTNEIDEMNSSFLCGCLNATYKEARESFILATTKTERVILDFAYLLETISILNKHEIAAFVYKTFEPLINNCDIVSFKKSTYSDIEFDFYRFITYELFVIFFSFLIREDRWELIADLLDEKIYLNNLRRDFKDQIMLINYVAREIKLLGDHNTRVDFIEKRYTTTELSKLISLQQFSEADSFLYLRGNLEYKKGFYQGGGYWLTPLKSYMESPPSYLNKAISVRYAERLLKPLGLENIRDFRFNLTQIITELQTELRRKNLYPFHNPFGNFNPQTIGTR